MTAEDLFGPTPLFLTIVILVFAVLGIGKAPFRVMGRGFRVLLLPFRVLARALRALNILPRSGARAATGPGIVGASGLSLFALPFGDTQVEGALAEAAGISPESTEPTLHDYSNEEGGIRRRGAMFRSIRILPRYMPDVNTLDDETAEIYRREADAFFSQLVQIESNQNAFYEDVEGAVAIRMFRARDRRFYYLANEMRKVINANVKMLALVYSGIIFAYFAVEIVLGGFAVLQFTDTFGASRAGAASVGLSHFEFNLASAVVCGAAMAFFYMLFAWSQERNSEQMRGFLNRYLSRLNDRYRQAIANARSVTVGDERDAQRASDAGRKWHKIVLWMSFRAFFVETFLRNVLYQIKRNSGFYVTGIPTVFMLLMIGFIYAVGLDPRTQVMIGLEPWYFWGLGGVLFILYAFLLNRSLKPSTEMDQFDWLGFDNLNVSQAMDQIVGGYVEEIVHLRNRVRGGGGGG